MENEEFERLENIQNLLNEGNTVPRKELDWLIKQLRIQDTMINLMAPKLTAPIHDEDWVKKYYKEEAEKRLCGK